MAVPSGCRSLTTRAGYATAAAVGRTSAAYARIRLDVRDSNPELTYWEQLHVSKSSGSWSSHSRMSGRDASTRFGAAGDDVCSSKTDADAMSRRGRSRVEGSPTRVPGPFALLRARIVVSVNDRPALAHWTTRPLDHSPRLRRAGPHRPLVLLPLSPPSSLTWDGTDDFGNRCIGTYFLPPKRQRASMRTRESCCSGSGSKL